MKSFGDKVCILCPNPATPAHVKTRGSGGDDETWNIVALCGLHHTEQGSMPIADFAERYDKYKEWLIKNNWEYIPHLNKWRHE